MIPGFGGQLISHAYLEEQILHPADRSHADGFDRQLLRWWRQTRRVLGPVSTARATHDVAVVPLLELLGHRINATAVEPPGIAARMDASSAIVLTLPWSMSTHSGWRDAIRRGTAAGASWALIANGRSLAIVDCHRAWSRAAIECDFATLLLAPSGVAALRQLASQSAMASREHGSLRSHVLASDAHGVRVCRVLSDGVLKALPQLAAALAGRRSVDARAFDQALTVVYRVLFLLFAEARSLVPMWHDIYRDAYSIDTLAARAVASNTRGLWEALQAIARLAHAGCVAGDLSVTAFNGRLFSPTHAPLVARARVPDAVIGDILMALATSVSPAGRRRISYHDLGVEQLGSVYERVLEYEPHRSGTQLTLSRTSTRRKSTGSFYTPRTLTEFLVRRTLAPLIAGKSAEHILQLRILDPAMGSGAFLVAACGYLAESCEAAMLRDEAVGERGAEARAALRRRIAEQCLYGVDLNPTAVQLARLSLWLTTLARDRPLTFLDHHLAAGNSLVGAWLADLSTPPRSHARPPRPLPLLDDLIAGDLESRIIPARLQLALEPSDSLEAVQRKERSLGELTRSSSPLTRWMEAAHLWCGAALSTDSPPAPALMRECLAFAMRVPTSLQESQMRPIIDRLSAGAAAHAAFHWELAFPEVFFDASGRPLAAPGFDAVIGNPPWDVLRADIGSAAQREDSRASTSAALRFFRTSRVYRHQGGGHGNVYQLFTERALQLTRRGGRIGLLLPSGIATDDGSSLLRRRLLEHTTIDTWLGFDNRDRIFPIHRSTRFVVLTTTNDGDTTTLRYRCRLTDPAVLARDDLFRDAAEISRSRLAALTPDRLTIPDVAHPSALSILTGIADRVPTLSDAAGWNVRFGRELNATDDRPHFVTLAAHPRTLPIIEGKQLSPFQVDVGRSTQGIDASTAASLIDRAISFARDRIAYRDVASATNKLTLIAAMLPAGTISTHTIFCSKTPLDADRQWCLLGLLNSLVANYLVRLAVTTHVTTAIVANLRVPVPPDGEMGQLAALSRSLGRRGIEHDAAGYARVNAIAARLYGVSADEYVSIVESFPLLPRPLRDACTRAYADATGLDHSPTA